MRNTTAVVGGRKVELPRPPFEFQEEVELYARESGRTAKLHFMFGCGWFARFSLRSSDKRLVLYQQGMAGKPPTEDTFFHYPNPREHEGLTLTELKGLGVPFLRPLIIWKRSRCHMPFIPLDIIQMGTSGVRQFLEKGNMWSGRGEFDSLTDQLRTIRDKEADAKRKMREDAREDTRKFVRDQRGRRFKVPTVSVPRDFRTPALTTAQADSTK